MSDLTQYKRPSTSQGTSVSTVVPDVPYSVLDTYDGGAGSYCLGSSITQNPTNPLIIFSLVDEGADHIYTGDKQLVGWRSEDGGVTRGTKITIITPTPPEAVQAASGGYDSRGRLHAFYSIMNGAGSYYQNRYTYSDDDGDTWSTPVVLTRDDSVDGDAAFLIIGKMIENAGVLMVTYYTDDSDGSSSRHVYRSTDYGATWTDILMVNNPTKWINESEIHALSDTHLIGLSRVYDAPYQFEQTMSTDNGLTWAVQGNPLFYSPALTSNSGPPALASFDMKGVKVIVCYHLSKGAGKIHAVYATAANLIANGVSGWTLGSKIDIIDDIYTLHYGCVIHPNNTMNGLGMFSREISSPWTYTHNTVVWQNMPTTHYDTLRTQLGIA